MELHQREQNLHSPQIISIIVADELKAPQMNWPSAKERLKITDLLLRTLCMELH